MVCIQPFARTSRSSLIPSIQGTSFPFITIHCCGTPLWRITLCISCGVAWRGPGRRSGTASGRPVATSLHCTPRQGRARSVRQLHALVRARFGFTFQVSEKFCNLAWIIEYHYIACFVFCTHKLSKPRCVFLVNKPHYFYQFLGICGGKLRAVFGQLLSLTFPSC